MIPGSLMGRGYYTTLRPGWADKPFFVILSRSFRYIPIREAKHLYCAFNRGVSIFVNLSEHVPKELGRRLQRGVSGIQRGAVGQSIEQGRGMAQTFFDRYYTSLCVITMARDGVVYTNHSGTDHLPAHDVKVENTAGAGATFSAGLIFGRVRA